MSDNKREAIRVGVEGMTCRSCEKLLLLNISALDGVEAASVDAGAGTLIVFADPEKVGMNDIKRTVVASGLYPNDGVIDPHAHPKARERMAVLIEGEDYVI